MRPLLLTMTLLLSTAAQAQPLMADFDGGAIPALEFPWLSFTASPAAPAPAGPALSTVIVSSATGRDLDPQGLVSALAGADLVYVGESHDKALHHRVQIEVIMGLFREKPGLQVGLEMLDVTQQPQLDAYLDGSMSESDFKDFWKKAWGYDFELYKPILDYARNNGIPVKALNAPISVMRNIVRKGLDKLTPEERALLPAVIHPIKDPRYLEYVKRSLDGHGPMPPEIKERMILAQAVWNETMAQSALAALPRGPMVVVAGMGHVFFNAAIMESVRNRSGAVQASVLPFPLDGEDLPLAEVRRRLMDPASGNLSLADYFWLLPNGTVF